MSVTRTVRIEEDVERGLQRLAKDRGVSMNFLVNKTLRKLVEWDAPADKFRLISLDASLLAKIMGYLTDEEARELGRWAADNVFKMHIEFRFKELSLKTVLQGLSVVSRYDNAFDLAHELGHTIDESEHMIILRHELGHRWSLYYRGMLEFVFAELLKHEAKVECSDHLCVVRFGVS